MKKANAALVVAGILSTVPWLALSCAGQSTAAPRLSDTPTPSASTAPSSTPTLQDVVSQAKESIARVVAGDSTGTAFVVSSDGLLLTAGHVVQGLDKVWVELPGRPPMEADVKGYHVPGDVAALQVGLAGLPALRLGDSTTLVAGDTVVKLSYGHDVPEGPIATVGPASCSGHKGRWGVELVEVASPTRPGESGSPLLDSTGAVIGIASAAHRADDPAVGLATAIDVVKNDIMSMARGDTVCQSFPALLEGFQYHNQKYGYTVTVPQQFYWEYGESDEGEVVFGRLKENSCCQGILPPAAVFVSASPRENYPTLASYVEHWVSFLGESYSGLQTWTMRPVCHPTGGVALELDASLSSRGLDYLERWTVFVAGRYVFFFEQYAWPDKWDAHQSSMDTVLYSFRLDE